MVLSPPDSPRRRALTWLLPIVAAMICMQVFTTRAAEAQVDDGLDVMSSITYAPNTQLEQIDVSATYSMTNVQPDEVIGDTVRSFFYTKWVVAVPTNATELSATSNGAALATTAAPDPRSEHITFVTIALPFDLSYAQTVQVDVTYTIPGSEPRTGGSAARVNGSFLSFSVWAAGDPGMTDVRVLVPSGFTMNLQGELDEFETVERDGGVQLEAVDIDDPARFFGQVYGRNDEGLLTAFAALPGATATVRAWPDDPEWSDFVVDAIEDDIPVIETLTGLDWPVGDIEVIETVTPYLFGYGGWFNASSGVIEIGDNLERDLILHELSHAWFNDQLIGGRWITEGLAEEYASRVIEASGGERPDPTEPDLDDPVRVPLAEWASPWTLDEDDAFAYEQYHYNAAWWVLRQISEEVGLTALADVLAALRDDRLPYAGNGPIERTKQPTRWVHFFDLLEFEAGATEVDHLFATYVLSEADSALLAQRRAALDAYRSLAEVAGEWAVPVAIRVAMSEWDFGRASQRIEDAHTVIELRDESNRLSNELQVTIDRDARMEFEGASTAAGLAIARNIETARNRNLVDLAADRADLQARSSALGTAVDFAPMPYLDAVTDIATQRSALASVGDLRARIDEYSASLGLVAPAWPSNREGVNVSAASDLVEARLAVLVAIERTMAHVEEPRGLFEKIGLWRADVAGVIATARTAFEADDLDQALAATGDADQLLMRAHETGRRRALWLATASTFLVLAGVGSRIVLRSDHRDTDGALRFVSAGEESA